MSEKAIRLLALGIGMCIFLFSTGNLLIPLAAWLAPAFLLVYSRTARPLAALLLLLGLFTIACYFMLYGIIPPHLGMLSYILTVYYALLMWIPYVVDRILFHRLSGLPSTLVFPSTMVVVDYIAGIALGTWNSPAYSQYTDLALNQLASVTGMWGITFIIAWFGSVASRACINRQVRRSWMPAVAAFVVVFLVVHAFGGLRLTLSQHSADTVMVAAVTDGENSDDMKQAITAAGATSLFNLRFIDPALAASLSGARTDSLLQLTETAADAGARLVLWSEGVTSLTPEEEAALVDKTALLARNRDIHIGLSGFVTPEAYPDTPGENMTRLVTPTGQSAWRFRKARPVPGARENPGDGILPLQPAFGGTLSTAICYDMDFPDLVGSRPAQSIDLILVPGWDWNGITPLHSRMAAMRSIENGYSMLRSTGEGLSIAVDPYGRTLARKDYFASTSYIMFADIPARGTWTLYAVAGDWFAWLNIAVLVGLIVSGLLKRRPRSSAHRSGSETA